MRVTMGERSRGRRHHPSAPARPCWLLGACPLPWRGLGGLPSTTTSSGASPPALASALTSTLALTVALASTLTPALAVALASTLALTLASTLALTLASGLASLALTLAIALASALTSLAITLASTLASLALATALASGRSLARAVLHRCRCDGPAQECGQQFRILILVRQTVPFLRTAGAGEADLPALVLADEVGRHSRHGELFARDRARGIDDRHRRGVGPASTFTLALAPALTTTLTVALTQALTLTVALATTLKTA